MTRLLLLKKQKFCENPLKNHNFSKIPLFKQENSENKNSLSLKNLKNLQMKDLFFLIFLGLKRNKIES